MAVRPSRASCVPPHVCASDDAMAPSRTESAGIEVTETLVSVRAERMPIKVIARVVGCSKNTEEGDSR